MARSSHAYLDWKLSGDEAWLKTMWPRVKKASSLRGFLEAGMQTADGVLDGVQHNTYDVEFYGPNPLAESTTWGLCARRKRWDVPPRDDASANE